MKIPDTDFSQIQKIIENFKKDKTDEEVFYHICFCVLVPQARFSAAREAVKILQGKDFYNRNLHRSTLEGITKTVRFYRRKADFLLSLKKNRDRIVRLVKDEVHDDQNKRALIASEIKGVGMKEASHLMRNLGHTGLAIIDKHILKFMGATSPKSPKEYIMLEQRFIQQARQWGYDPTTLDCYIWKVQSGTEYAHYEY